MAEKSTKEAIAFEIKNKATVVNQASHSVRVATQTNNTRCVQVLVKALKTAFVNSQTIIMTAPHSIFTICESILTIVSADS